MAIIYVGEDGEPMGFLRSFDAKKITKIVSKRILTPPLILVIMWK